MLAHKTFASGRTGEMLGSGTLREVLQRNWKLHGHSVSQLLEMSEAKIVLGDWEAVRVLICTANDPVLVGRQYTNRTLNVGVVQCNYMTVLMNGTTNDAVSLSAERV